MTSHGKRKKLGQHFLADPSIALRIAQASGAGHGDIPLVEIGPGMGALTGPLLDLGARVIALELDAELTRRLEKEYAGRSNLEVRQANALKFDYASLPSPFRVASNLPYSVATPIITRLISFKALIDSMVLMTQKEVAQRLCAQAGEEGYGALSVFVGYHCRREYLFDVPPGAFRPRPKVDSGVIRLIPSRTPPVEVGDEEEFFKMVRAAFAHRRKTIKNNLGPLWPGLEPFLAALERAGVAPSARAEEISLHQFASLRGSLLESRDESLPGRDQR